jgi:hypothetical protein
MIAYDGSNRPYPNLGISDGHHNLSHHENDAEKKKRIAEINRFHMTAYSTFLQKLKATAEGDGTLLDKCLIVYGSGISDGNSHSHSNLPILLAGGASGAVKTGRHVRLEKETPMTNLYLSMLDIMGASIERFGDSTGKLRQLAG